MKHDGWTESEFGCGAWKAECSCGFVSEAVGDEAEATALLMAHYEATK